MKYGWIDYSIITLIHDPAEEAACLCNEATITEATLSVSRQPPPFGKPVQL